MRRTDAVPRSSEGSGWRPGRWVGVAAPPGPLGRSPADPRSRGGSGAAATSGWGRGRRTTAEGPTTNRAAPAPGGRRHVRSVRTRIGAAPAKRPPGRWNGGDRPSCGDEVRGAERPRGAQGLRVDHGVGRRGPRGRGRDDRRSARPQRGRQDDAGLDRRGPAPAGRRDGHGRRRRRGRAHRSALSGSSAWPPRTPASTCRSRCGRTSRSSPAWRGSADVSGGRASKPVAETLDLTALLDRRTAQLSGGERRRVHTAIALVHRPRLVLLDEPTTGADVRTRAEILGMVRDLADTGSAVVYSTHYLHEVEDLDATVAVIDRGRIVAGGGVDALIDEYGSSVLELTFADHRARRGPAGGVDRGGLVGADPRGRPGGRGGGAADPPRRAGDAAALDRGGPPQPRIRVPGGHRAPVPRRRAGTRR